MNYEQMSKIDPEKYYSLKEILEANFFPWIQNEKTMRKWIDRDISYGEKGGVLKAVKVGEGGGTRYIVKGSNIIKFKTLFDEGGIIYP